ncbi:MAG TPA: aldo/keto reductase [Nitrospirota bacterium]|nr:aldo/keto reductase [Nitrospirota bacterium]
MQTRKLGNSDLLITPVGYGAWAIGGSGWEYAWGPQNDDDSIAAILRSLELGVNWIDTAAVYGLGHSEEVVAQALSDWKGQRPYIFTKCGLRWNRQGKVKISLKEESVRQECEDSLRRLRVDVIDLYQIHWPPGDNGSELEEGWSTLTSLKQEGKVRWIGVSNFDVAQMKRARSVAEITSLQPPYSLIRRGVEAEILPFCRKEGIGVIVYAPMASGLLTGKMTTERVENLPPDDWRKRNPEFSEPKLSRHLAMVERLRAVGKYHGRTAGEVAIAWTLRNPSVTGAIVGARSAMQVDGVMHAAELALSKMEIVDIERKAEY